MAAGLEHVIGLNAPKETVLQFVGQTLQLEQRNLAMNSFIKIIIDKMRMAGIYALLVKGQGVAQCYEKPNWRSCGDVDLYLSDNNYAAAKVLFSSQASNVDEEDKRRLHIGMTIDSWVLELHGSLYTSLSSRINKVLDDVHKSIFYDGSVRSWINDDVTVFLPSVDNDVIIIFSHFINHFYVGGVGLRQICD